MTCSLIITTYNWKEALEKVLESVIQQKNLPDEVIIADDGSRQDTADLIQRFQAIFPIPLIHSWQEDEGFRLSASRNKAIAKATNDYVIIIDGDMILDKNFIADHKACAERNFIILGNRVKLNKDLTKRLLDYEINSLSFLDIMFNSERKRLNFRLGSFCFKKFHFTGRGIIGSNMSLFRDDIVKINGFNEDFKSWGKEDEEFVLRAYNAGIRRKITFYSARALHLFHGEEHRGTSEKNINLFNQARDNMLTSCQNGIGQYI